MYKSLIQNTVRYGISALGGYVREQDINRINIEILDPCVRIIQKNARWCRIENLFMTAGARSAHNLSTLRNAMLRDGGLRKSTKSHTPPKIEEKTIRPEIVENTWRQKKLRIY